MSLAFGLRSLCSCMSNSPCALMKAEGTSYEHIISPEVYVGPPGFPLLEICLSVYLCTTEAVGINYAGFFLYILVHNSSTYIHESRCCCHPYGGAWFVLLRQYL